MESANLNTTPSRCRNPFVVAFVSLWYEQARTPRSALRERPLLDGGPRPDDRSRRGRGRGDRRGARRRGRDQGVSGGRRLEQGRRGARAGVGRTQRHARPRDELRRYRRAARQVSAGDDPAARQRRLRLRDGSRGRVDAGSLEVHQRQGRAGARDHPDGDPLRDGHLRGSRAADERRRRRRSPLSLAMKVSDRVEAVPPSGIRRFFELAEEMDDVISLGVGEPDFSAPWAAREAAIASLERGRTSYTANRGRKDLREEIAAHVAERYGLEYDPDDEIIVTTGVSEGVDVALRALIDPGDVVAVPQPSYVSYEPGITFAGGQPLPVPTSDD